MHKITGRKHEKVVTFFSFRERDWEVDLTV